jgi:hypothetical protein
MIVAAAAIAACAYAIAPSALFQRFKGSGILQEDSQDPRQRILAASIRHIPEYGLLGVGFGNYPSWGSQTGLANKRGRTVQPHNSYFAVWMYWGAPALLSFALMFYLAFRCLPKGVGRDPLALCLLGLAVAMFLRLLFTHVFYVKDFSAILGLLAAARLWVWRGKPVQMATAVRARRRQNTPPIHQRLFEGRSHGP